MLIMNKCDGIIKGTKTELLSDLAITMRIMLDKKIVTEDDLVFCISTALTIDSNVMKKFGIEDLLDGSENS